MATISGGRKHTRALVTVDTESFHPEGFDGPEVTRERWVLRSDGALLSRVVSYGPPTNPTQQRPSSGFRIVRKYALKDTSNPVTLRAAVVRRVEALGRTVVGA